MSKMLLSILFALAAANASVYASLAAVFAVRGARAHFLSVGQGDAELLQVGNVNMLIDAGPSQRTVQELDALIPQNRRVLDIVVLTHPNSDHVAGLLEILKRYDVRLVMANGVETTNATDKAIEDLERARHIPVVYARQGMHVDFGNQGIFSIVWPNRNIGVNQLLPSSKLNDSAITGLFSSGSATALFTGDITAVVEKQLAPLLVDIDILKVAHHGSKTSTSDAFVKRTKPDYAIIETGKNSYGLPTREVMDRLRAAGARVFRTDMDGTLSFAIENGAWKLQER